MRALVVVLVLCCGCATANRAAIVASTAALACDWAQTRRMAASGWPGTYEDNPVLGMRPGVSRVEMYFASVAIANIALYLLLPERYRAVVPTAVTAAQVHSVAQNVEHSGMCI